MERKGWGRRRKKAGKWEWGSNRIVVAKQKGSFGRQKGRKYAVKTMYDKMGI